MNTKNNSKKKGSLFDSKNLIVLGIAAAVVALFAIIMTALMPADVARDQEASFDKPAIESSVMDTDKAPYDSGLNAVYNEKAVTSANQQDDNYRQENDQDQAFPDETKSGDEKEQQKTEQGADKSDKTMNFGFPVSGAVVKDYSGDNLVYSDTLKDWRTHNGIDFYADEGTDVVAVADGTVEAITDNGMFGRSVIVLHDGGIRSIYSNLAEGEEVAIGDNVLKGTPIGRVGSTATAEVAEKPHLHFEISLNEETVNPHDYLPQAQENETE